MSCSRCGRKPRQIPPPSSAGRPGTAPSPAQRGGARSPKEIIEGMHDQIPESYFLYTGTIDEVVEKWKGENA